MGEVALKIVAAGARDATASNTFLLDSLNWQAQDAHLF